MTSPLDFQTIILTLQRFWAQQGCLIWQPYYTQVGAGTMNPATYLRVLGPEPWNVAYVEPSVRPDDGRYGENPNRLQQHYQFQVILKPDPGNPQEIYLKSLEALGIDPRQHDIRFVEDNWESPALGAWGLGWEVWLDGQEITQFTYFQQAGGMVLEPVSVEITYGLERIAIALQGVRSFRDIRWSQDRLYGEVNLQGEQEHSQYYFEIADVERLRQMFKLYEEEAEASLARGLVLPAHDYVLKCSHTFNILDTRGAVGVTERQALFGRMRDLSRRVAEAYAAQRKEMGYPWKIENRAPADTSGLTPVKTMDVIPESRIPAAFLLEIGTEELPAADLQSAVAQLRERVPALLDEARLEHGEVRVMGTPRRLVVAVDNLAPRQPDAVTVVKGPPAGRAFDTQGKPTPAAEGFARGRGLQVSDLQVREMDGGSYVAAVVQQPGKSAGEVLANALPGLVGGIRFDKTMRWNSDGAAFSRPVRWLVALLGGSVVPFGYAGLVAGRVTRGLRFHQSEAVELHSAADYFESLLSQGILLDAEDRKRVIATQVSALAVEAGGSAVLDEDLLDEVTCLVEAPTALLGDFEPGFLDLPAEVLVSVMKKHQRYFPVQKEDGSLLPCFIAVRNGDDRHLDVVTDGNEQVLQARFADARFFIEEDLKQPLEGYLPRLGTLTFQFKLGSMLDRTTRIEKLVETLIPALGLPAKEAAAARRAARLCKADLVTHMVVEMTSLQGSMGRYYAARSGESPAVAQAIQQHYLPRFSGDAVPTSQAALVIGLADRLDALTGLFAAGLAPTGTRDPYAQRRMALGLVQLLVARNLDFDLPQALARAAAVQPIQVTPESQAACLEFITGRLRSMLLDQGWRYDVVEAVLAAQPGNPAGAARSVEELAAWVARPDWGTILPAFSRCVRITRDQKQRFTIQSDLMREPAEIELLKRLAAAEIAAVRPKNLGDFFKAFLPLIPFINTFFEAVLVMDEDAGLRGNRLGLLQRIASLADGIVDFSRLEGF